MEDEPTSLGVDGSGVFQIASGGVLRPGSDRQEQQWNYEVKKCEMNENEEAELDEDQYHTEDFISRGFYSENSSFEQNPIELEYSYGYNCHEPNLCVVDPDTILWHTGNIIHIFNAKQKKLSFRRSAQGQDICFLTRSKRGTMFAVGESGGKGNATAPIIIVYEWPDFKVKSVLKGGAMESYQCADFNCDDDKLVSQAGSPDGSLVIWNVQEQIPVITLHNPDVAVTKVEFSPYDPDSFITCGRGHIKFWRLVDTFTGQKIDCQPGRFGEFEDNDVSALYFLPDRRVVTNFRQRDLAIWRPSAMLELDFSMKNSESCHSELVTFIQIYIEDNHVYTAGMDGAIRVWNYSYITSFYNDDQQDSIHIDIDPSYERVIKDVKTGRTGVPVLLLPKDRLEFPYHYYAQDARGGIWILDLELKKNPDPWSLLYISHAGPINDISTSPADYYFVSLGDGGKLNVYNHTDRSLFAFKQFNEVPTVVLWLPLAIDPTGCSVLVGFKTGLLRVVAVAVKFSNPQPNDEHVQVVQTLKPHHASITAIVANKFRKLLLTGSEDSSVFIYGYHKLPVAVSLVPLGMVEMPASVCHITWNPYLIRENVAMVTCVNGQAVEMRITDEHLETFLETLENRETYLVEIPLVTTSANVRSKKTKPRKYFSKYVSKSLVWIEDQRTTHRYHNNIYLVGKNEPVAKLNISGGQTVQCCVDARAQSHMILGLNNGRIKIIRRHAEPNNFTDNFEIVMHNTKSTITKLSFSHDYRILYSCGSDSGIFAYKVNFEGESRPVSLPEIVELPQETAEVVPELSLEQEKIREKLNREHDAHKAKVEHFNENLLRFLNAYYKLIEFNKALPKSLRVPKTFFRLETSEERAKEKQRMLEQDEKLLAPLRERQKQVFERVHKIKKHFIDPVKTPKFHLFAIREPNYLKSFPERKLFTDDPVGLTECDVQNQKRHDELEKLLTGVQPTQPHHTEFERMVGKIQAKLDKEKEIAAAYEYKPTLSGKKSAQDGAQGDTNDNIPDLITGAGDFLIEYDKFTPTEKHVFRRINNNRLKRLKCHREMLKIGQLQKEFQNEHDKIEGLFKNFLKAEVKDREVFPPVVEKLHDLLNLRQLIYLQKETFNKKLKALRQEKTAIINYYYWAQEEYKYMVEDMKFWGLPVDFRELPPPLEVVWDLEYPDMLKFNPGPAPKSIAVRMELHKQEFDKIQNALPVKGKVGPSTVQGHLAPLLQYRQENFKNAMITIRETLDNMIREFDKKFSPLLLERAKVSVELYELKSQYVSTMQEVDVLYRFEALQCSASVYKYEVIKIKHVYILRENIRKKKMEVFHEQTKECVRTIEDLNAKFADMVKEDKWARHLTRVYKRKFKPQKRESQGSVDDSESSSEDDDIYDDEIDDDDDDESNKKIVAYMYDETIMPPGCDEDRFKQTFKFRGQRHVEESKIADIRRERDKLAEEMKSIRRQIIVIDVLLAFFYAGTYRFQKLMKEEMDDVEYLVKLHPSQIQIFDKKDPFNAVPCLEECKLIEQEDYLAKVRTMEEMKRIIQDMNQLVDKTQKGMKTQTKDLTKLVETNREMEHKIEHLLKEKFGKYVNVDEAQTFVLTEMIKKAIKRSAKTIHDKEQVHTAELRKMEAHKQNEDILKTKKDRVKTLQTLYTIEAEKNRILADKLMRDKKAEAGQKVRRDLNSERDSLAKKLLDTEEMEKRLLEALNDI